MTQIVTIGYRSLISNLPLFVAAEKGWFEDENIEVNLREFRSPEDEIFSLLKGEIQISAINGLSTHFSLAVKHKKEYFENIRLFLIAVETKEKSPASILVRREDIHYVSLEDLKSRKIGCLKSKTAKISLDLILESKGIDPDKDVCIELLAQDRHIENLIRGEIDALFTFEPFVTVAKEKGARILIRRPECDIVSPFPAGAFGVNFSFFKNNKEIAQKYWKLLEKSVDFIRKNEREAKKLSGKYLPLPDNILEKCTVYKWWKSEETRTDKLQELADTLYRYKILPENLDVSKLILFQ